MDPQDMGTVFVAGAIPCVGANPLRHPQSCVSLRFEAATRVPEYSHTHFQPWTATTGGESNGGLKARRMGTEAAKRGNALRRHYEHIKSAHPQAYAALRLEAATRRREPLRSETRCGVTTIALKPIRRARQRSRRARSSGSHRLAVSMTEARVTGQPPWALDASAAVMKAKISMVSSAGTGISPVLKNLTIRSTRWP